LVYDRNGGNSFNYEFTNLSAFIDLKEAKNIRGNSIEVIQNLPWSILIQLAPEDGEIKFGVFLKLEIKTECRFVVDVEFEMRILNHLDKSKTIKEGIQFFDKLLKLFFN
jgi:hypothetical protein